MGVKFGRFTGRNGHEYEVRISGASVTNGEVQLSSTPAYVAMAAGERKFCGYKSSTARVQILTDVPLVDLYASSPTSVMLSIEDVTDHVFEFEGYVTPFAFDQPYTGRLDAVTVNAVDRITANKDTKYTNLSLPQTEYGTDRNALDIVTIIAQRAGVERLVVHTNFDTLTDGNSSPLAVPVAQAGFLQDEVTNLEALNAICMFFGYTATCVGDTLYLWDEHCFTHAPDQGKVTNCNVYSWADDEDVWYRTEHYYDAQDSPLGEQFINAKKMLNDLSVTIERAYDGIQITPEGSDTSVLLPDVCADEYLADDNRGLDIYGDRRHYTDSDTQDDTTYTSIRVAMGHKLLDVGYGGATSPTDWPANQPLEDGDFMTPGKSISGSRVGAWSDGAIPLKYYVSTKETSGELVTAMGASSRVMLWVRCKDGLTSAIQKVTYSHTGGYMRVVIDAYGVSVFEANGETYSRGTYVPEGKYAKSLYSDLEWLRLRVGERYQTSADNDYNEGWTTDKSQADLQMSIGDSGTYPSARAIAHFDSGYVVQVPDGGAVGIEIGYTSPYAGGLQLFIKELRIEGVGDAINLEHANMRHYFIDSPRELLEVSGMLTTRKSGVTSYVSPDGKLPYGVNARPSVVPATYWNGGYMGRLNRESIPISGILMAQLRARYAEPHPAYTMTVEQLLQPYRPTWWGGNLYTVEAYERDLYNSTTTITLD